MPVFVEGKSRARPVLSWVGRKSRTKQSFKDEVDINKIIARFQKTGVLPHVDAEALYGDFSSVPSYQDSIAIVRKAEAQFAGLEAKVRDRFVNDPLKFLEFVSNPANREEMYTLGLAVRPAPVTPVVP